MVFSLLWPQRRKNIWKVNKWFNRYDPPSVLHFLWGLNPRYFAVRSVSPFILMWSTCNPIRRSTACFGTKTLKSVWINQFLLDSQGPDTVLTDLVMAQLFPSTRKPSENVVWNTNKCLIRRKEANYLDPPLKSQNHILLHMPKVESWEDGPYSFFFLLSY